MKALLIRHASTTGQAPEAPLSPAGEAEAEALSPRLAALGAGPLYASPYRRAEATLAPYAAATSQEITLLNGLLERMLSPTPLPDWKEHLERSFTEPDHAPEGGESHTDLLARAAVELRRIEAIGGPLPCFVTHGGMTGALLNAADPGFGFAGYTRLTNPDLFAVTLEDGRITTFERLDLEAT